MGERVDNGEAEERGWKVDVPVLIWDLDVHHCSGSLVAVVIVIGVVEEVVVDDLAALPFSCFFF